MKGWKNSPFSYLERSFSSACRCSSSGWSCTFSCAAVESAAVEAVVRIGNGTGRKSPCHHDHSHGSFRPPAAPRFCSVSGSASGASDQKAHMCTTLPSTPAGYLVSRQVPECARGAPQDARGRFWREGFAEHSAVEATIRQVCGGTVDGLGSYSRYCAASEECERSRGVHPNAVVVLVLEATR